MMSRMAMGGMLLIAASAVAGEGGIAWSSGYHEALDQAETTSKLALLWFFEESFAENSSGANERFEVEQLQDQEIVAKLAENFTAVKLSTSATIESGGRVLKLLDHPAFAELARSPGLAIIDMSEPEGPLYRQVVSVYPFKHEPISLAKLKVLLDLPRGTLTQRTLIFAVRTHPEQPASAIGELSSILTRETENHAWHQASIGLQGHHNWDSRFHAINAQLPGGLAAREVCAESWPGQSLVDAAEECVDSWRQSPGHWEAVSSRHALFGYDMKRGANGIWYAAGIFASR
jgi:hypothetical protein